MHLLPPATNLRQGNVFTRVCHFVHTGVSATPPGRHHPSGQTLPRADTPWADTPLGIHPLWVDTPWADTSPAQCMLGYTHTPAQCMLGYTPLCSACWDTVNKWAVCIPLECILVTVRNEVVKVMFLHLSVCPRGGGGLPQCMLGYLPPREQAPPQRTDIPPPKDRHPPSRRLLLQTVRILLECILARY